MRLALLLSCLLVPFLANAQSALAEYVECMEKGEDPVEYIFRLFEESDIVILGERDHRDVTQYEFIHKLIADPRFAERIGYVYTEVGVTNMTQRANSLIKGHFTSQEEYRMARTNYLRDEDYLFCWEKTNRSIFIDSLYSINSRLPKESKITLGLTDVEFDWYKAESPSEYRKWYDKLDKNYERDRIMAKNFIRLYKKQKPIGGHRKALLITNLPHAINEGSCKREGFWIKKKFGRNRVKIVCFNWYSAESEVVLIDEGRWDAAFELTECKPVAFDVQGTPFGQTVYSCWAATDEGKHWQDYVDGVIFYEPFYRFLGSAGIEGFVADSCKEEQMRRLNLLKDAGVYSSNNYESQKSYCNTVRTFSCEPKDVLDKMKQQVDSLVIQYKGTY